MTKSYIPVLTIAGSDSSGGAGIQADIKTMSALGCYGMSAITAITAQNTTGVSDIQGINPEIVSAQIDMVFRDICPRAVKTGMLFSSEVVNVVAETLKLHNARNIVIDPVMVSTSGSRLISDDAIEAVVQKLFPIATLITPNRAEAIVLTDVSDVETQAKILRDMGARNILLKGGDSDDTDFKTDYLMLEDSPTLLPIKSEAIETKNTHGTGCTLSSAIACYLALGLDLKMSVLRSKEYITQALVAGKSVITGHGHGPVNHFFMPEKLKITEQ